MTYMKLEKYSEAEEDCTRAIKHDPTYEKALFRRLESGNMWKANQLHIKKS